MTNQRPTISIKVSTSMIMIHKKTLRILGNPEYIQFLVNPSEKAIILCCSNETDHLAHHIREDVLRCRKKTCRFHSHQLLQNLYKICSCWTENDTYKIYGEFISTINIIKFDMRNSVISTRYALEE